MTPGRIAIVGGGWAGLAAAVEAVRLGHAVTLFEMAPQLGGRARAVVLGETPTRVVAPSAHESNAPGIDASIAVEGTPDAQRPGGLTVDNGQHILIGAYASTLQLMRTVGVDVGAAFVRTPLRITYPDGHGLRLEAGSPVIAFSRAVLAQRGWPLCEQAALLATAMRWALHGFRCDPALTVAALTARLPARIRHELIDPLCVAALNTSSAEASAAVFLRVMKDALFSGPGSADLLLPRVDLSALLPTPASAWLARSGAAVRLAHRVDAIVAAGERWQVDGEAFDRVVLACTPGESARLARTIAPEWAGVAAALHYEPIITVYLHGTGQRLAEPMLALRDDEDFPAQFVFDRGQLGGPHGLLAFVISGARHWVERGVPTVEAAVLQQARSVIGRDVQATSITLTEKRATFRCTPALLRAPAGIAPGLAAAGDHVEGPYPATLEGAVRSGIAAVRFLA